MSESYHTPAGWSSMLEALAASGPYPEHADKLRLFGQLVGSWDIEARYFTPDGMVTQERRGEWHFGWALDGRAIQDVIISPPRAEQRQTGAPFHEYGTTVRFYDPRLDAWQVTFVAPIFGGIVNLIARPASDGIVLEGRAPDGKRYRWTFSEITADAFRWRGYWSVDEGQTWVLDEEMHARRRP